MNGEKTCLDEAKQKVAKRTASCMACQPLVGQLSKREYSWSVMKRQTARNELPAKTRVSKNEENETKQDTVGNTP